MNRDTLEMLNRVQRRGLSLDDALAVRRIAMTLTRWYELECGDGNGYIERDETTGKPYYYNANSRYVDPNDPRARWPIPDREKGAIRRLDKIMARYPGLRYYLQTDPRGASVYLYNPADLNGGGIDWCYIDIGTAVYR